MEGQSKCRLLFAGVYSHVYKQLSFPEEVIPEKAESTLKDGLLEVSIPKKTPSPTPKKHKVAVK